MGHIYSMRIQTYSWANGKKVNILTFTLKPSSCTASFAAIDQWPTEVCKALVFSKKTCFAADKEGTYMSYHHQDSKSLVEDGPKSAPVSYH